MKHCFTLLAVAVLLCAGISASAQTNQFVTYNAANTIAFANTGNNFKCIAIGDSSIWAGTQYKGLFKYDTALKVWIQSQNLTNVFINDIKRDKNGGIWVAQSGTSGTSGGGSNTAGGVNYFPEDYDFNMQFFSVPGTTTGGGLVSRNMRSIYIDTTFTPVAPDTLPRVWAVAGSYITSGNTAAGGISLGLNPTQNYFDNKRYGLQVVPYVNSFQAGTPSADAVGGNKDEVWVSVRQNFGLSQILRFTPSKTLTDGAFIGTYDSTTVKGGVFLPGFRALAIFFDSEGKRWLGLQSGGIRVWERGVWTIVNMPSILPAGTTVNNNAITEDDRGNIYIGTTNGLLVYDAKGNVDDVADYTVYTTADGLPSNNITGLGYDKAKGRMLITSDAGVTFWTVRNKIDVSLDWDYSFPERNGKPKGVAADGVARLYIKVKNGDSTLPAIKNVTLKLDDYQAVDSSLRGKFKIPTNITSYTEEATGANATEVTGTDNLKAKEVWFWYVAPNNFCTDTLGDYANISTRTEKIKVVVTYVNNVKDSILYDGLRIVRPPLVLVHGLASGPGTWDSFKHNGTTPFVLSNRFKYSHALTMSGRALFIKNAQLLLSGDIAMDTAQGKTNTLQGNIEAMRNLGYAANQVDYVCHSMGGIMIRHAIARLDYKFYTGASNNNRYKNYMAGFTHKIIFLNSPHNSSILGDGVDEFIPQAPEWINNIMRAGYLAFPQSQMPYDFIQPITPDDLLHTKFKASDAVNNLQVTDTRGGVNLARTNAKVHLVAGNVNLLDPAVTATLAEFDPTVKYVNQVITCMLHSKLVPQNIKQYVLQPMLVLGNTARVFTFFEWYSRNLGFPDYLSKSDIIVPLASEYARMEPIGNKYITTFENSPGSSFDASHVTILKRLDVGQRVFDLLNSPLWSPLFGDVVPANTDPDPLPILQPRPAGTGNKTAGVLADSTFYDTTKIRIDAPLKNTDQFADSTISIKFRLKDTANLAYVNIHLQSADSFRINKTFAQQNIPLKLIPDYSGSQTIWAVAAYYTPDDGMLYYIDTFSVNVKNNAPLQGFRADSNNVITVSGENVYYPYYQAKYNDKWTALSAFDPAIGVSLTPAGVLQQDATTKGFTVLKEGVVSAIFSYNGYNDTVLIQTSLPLASFCINKTIAAGSFKNPAIWSKGVVPDVCDSVVIQHAVTLDTTLEFRSLRINSGASFTVNNATLNTRIGSVYDATSMIDNYGSLIIQNGTLTVQGRIKLNAASTFTMSGGLLKIDGNTGFNDQSIANGTALFEAVTGMSSFSFTAGTLQIVDPPLGASSQALSSAYDFGDNSILMLGLNTSTTTSNNTDGFGGTLFPNKIGKLIIDAGIKTGNRQFINKKALSVKGGVEVRTGSGVIIQAPINVIHQ